MYLGNGFDFTPHEITKSCFLMLHTHLVSLPKMLIAPVFSWRSSYFSISASDHLPNCPVCSFHSLSPFSHYSVFQCHVFYLQSTYHYLKLCVCAHMCTCWFMSVCHTGLKAPWRLQTCVLFIRTIQFPAEKLAQKIYSLNIWGDSVVPWLRRRPWS